MTKQKKQVYKILENLEVVINETCHMLCIQLDDYKKEYGKPMLLNPLELLCLQMISDLGKIVQKLSNDLHKN